MLAGKVGDIRHAVGHLSADGVEALEAGTLHDMILAIFDDAMELVETLGSLGIEGDVAAEIQLAYLPEMLHILQLLYHDGMTFGLTYQAQHLGMSLLTEDDDLRLGIVDILLFDAALKLEHHRAGGIDNLDTNTAASGYKYGCVGLRI